ncbi:MAG: ATP-binding cassette domain-containing protein [Acidimicrobiales bacterium]|nr:ATP-binding cassette domain-containing protein [Hyphomonadaceae bacterium]RZV41761.1 MAG: ATP-binding cassette domain-containing protein [Acidimicrobiales bacterium]
MARVDYNNLDLTAPVEARGLRTQFGTNVVHDNLHIRLNAGEILGVVGGSGSGKSVLLNTLLGLKEPDGGVIRVFGKERHSMSDEERRALDTRVGVLFQGGALFSSLSLRENVMVPMREHTDLPLKLMQELADMKINMVGLPMSAASLHPSDLSGGMKKRAGLARALALDPQMLFLDEPTAGLDPIGAHAFDELILELRDALNLTVFLVTHDLDTLFATSDRIAVLVDKHIAIADSPDNVVKYEHPWVREYFGGPRSRAASHGKSN